jgi:Zn-dependent protease with chaperone function
MTGRGLSWLLAVPLTIAASQVGHELAYRTAAPDAHMRAHLLEESGHAYLQHLPLALGLVSVLAAFALIAQVRAATGRRAGIRLTLVPYAAVPPAVFVLQEHFERLLHDGSFPLGAVAEPTFLLGLLFQLPFALLAFGLARLLIRAADEIGFALGGSTRPALEPLRLIAVSPEAVLPRTNPLALGYPQRGPPSTP